MIEFRFFGSAKQEIKALVNQINSKFGIRRRHRAVPHITLVGPFTTRDRRRLLFEFEKVCRSAKVMHFKVSGFDTFPWKRVVYINIIPDSNLKRFRRNLSRRLQNFCRLKSFDYEEIFHFHATLALKISFLKYLLLKRHVNRLEKPNYEQVMLRATLLCDGKILREYDFLQRKMLDRRSAKSKRELSLTFTKLRQYLKQVP